MWRICTAACATVAMFGVAHAQQTTSDEQYIKTAMEGGPPVVSGSATFVRMDQQAMRTLRQGNNGFTCLVMDTDKMCNDANSMEFIHAIMKHEAPPNKVGISYMLAGDTGVSNTDPYATGKTPGNHWIVTGPHIMIFGPPSKTLGYTRAQDPDPNQPYMMWAGTPYEHAMIPVAAPK